MRRLGNDQVLAEIYEDAGSYWRIILPRPVVTGALLDPTFPVEWDSVDRRARGIFREDYFDPTARIRRGRFYMPVDGQQPSPQKVLPRLAGDTTEGAFEKSLFVYEEYFLPATTKPPSLVALGTPGSVSLWRVAAPPERISTGELLFVLKVRHNFGVLPEIDLDKIPEAGRAKAIETLEALIDAAHRESPSSVVDRARDAAQWCLGTWAASKFGDIGLMTKDLGDIIKAIRNQPDQVIATDAANIIRTLHARKPNERERRGTRPVMEEC
jgi:hypothetical protein